MKNYSKQNRWFLVFVLLALTTLQAVAQSPSVSTTPDQTRTEELNNKRDTTPRSEVQFNYSIESLSNGFGEWRSASLDFTHKFRAQQAIYASLLTTDRFGRRDRQATVGFYQPFGRKWIVQAETGISPTHRSLPKWTAFAGIQRNFNKGWNAQAGYRRTQYSTAKVNLISAGAEKYFGNYRAAYTLNLSNLEQVGTSASHRFQLNRYYGEQVSSIGISAGFGRELESLGNRGVLQTDVQSVGISGRHWFNRQWGINYDASLTRQGNFYVRRGLTVGIRYRF